MDPQKYYLLEFRFAMLWNIAVYSPVGTAIADRDLETGAPGIALAL